MEIKVRLYKEKAVEGLRKMKDLVAMGGRETALAIAMDIAKAAQVTAPRRTGKLRNSLRVIQKKRRTEVKYTARYARALHWGGKYRDKPWHKWLREVLENRFPHLKKEKIRSVFVRRVLVQTPDGFTWKER